MELGVKLRSLAVVSYDAGSGGYDVLRGTLPHEDRWGSGAEAAAAAGAGDGRAGAGGSGGARLGGNLGDARVLAAGHDLAEALDVPRVHVALQAEYARP